MLNRLLEFGLRHRIWCFFAFLGLCALGVGAALRIPIDAVPDITNVQVVVNTKTGALDPEKIEKLVTYPIEAEVSGIPGVEDMRSLSKYGLSQVTVIFEEQTDIQKARQLVAERLQNVRDQLPERLTPQLAPVTTGLGEVLMYVLEAKPGSELASRPEKERLMYLRGVQEYTIRPQLKRIRGVADVDTNGGFSKQVHVNVFPERLEKNGLSFESLISRIESIGESHGGGYIQKDGKQIIVRSIGNPDGLKGLGEIPLKIGVTGGSVRVRDVAEVRTDHAQRLGAATASGSETVLGTVLMRIGANSREVAKGAEDALATLKVPEGVRVRILYTRSQLVNGTIRTVIKNLAEGGALVVVVLLLLIGHIRAALLVALAIPVSMLLTLKGMVMGGMSANLMSLGAIDFGLVVDGSVVLVENVVRRFQLLASGTRGFSLSKEEKLNTVLEAGREVIKPLVFGLLIIMVVYVPILYLEGIEGKMFRPMASTVLMALGGSLLVTLFLMPALCYLFLPSKIHEEKEPLFFRVLLRIYDPLLRKSLERPKRVFLILVLPALLAVPVAFRLGSDFVPQLDEGDIVLNMTRETRQDIDTSVMWQKRAEAIIGKFGEVEHVFSRMGTPESALDPMGAYLADAFIILKPDRADWPKVDGRARTKDELVSAIREALEKDNPDQEISLTQPIEMRFNEMLEGSRADVSLQIIGPDLERLFELSDRAREILSGIRGIDSIETDPLTALTKGTVMDVSLDFDRISRFGFDVKDVNAILEAAMGGREIGSFFESDRRIPVIVHLDEALRNNPEQIGRIPVGLKNGGTVPLSSVTDLKVRDVVTTIARNTSRRYSGLSISLKDRDIGSFVQEARERIDSQLKLPEGFEVAWGGQFKNLEKARGRLAWILPVTLLGILLLLFLNFGETRQALLVFSAVPFAMVGGVFSLYIRDIHFSVSAAVGFIALAGIAILNSMILVSFFKQLRDSGLPLRETAIQGALSRLRPVAMTAFVASLGFIPMAVSSGTGSEVQRPLATVVIGGLFTSTLLTLILIPVLYVWLGERKSRNALSADENDRIA